MPARRLKRLMASPPMMAAGRALGQLSDHLLGDRQVMCEGHRQSHQMRLPFGGLSDDRRGGYIRTEILDIPTGELKRIRHHTQTDAVMVAGDAGQQQ